MLKSPDIYIHFSFSTRYVQLGTALKKEKARFPNQTQTRVGLSSAAYRLFVFSWMFNPNSLVRTGPAVFNKYTANLAMIIYDYYSMCVESGNKFII